MYMKFQRKSLRLDGSKLVIENLGEPVVGRGNYQANRQACNKAYAAAMNALMRNRRDTFEVFALIVCSEDRNKLNLKEVNEI